MKERAIPFRRCTGCNQRRPKEELDRYVFCGSEGYYEYDPTGRAEGRGTYLCRASAECMKKAVKRKKAEFRRDDEQ